MPDQQQQSSDTSWIGWGVAITGGVALLGLLGVAVAGAKALPYALAYGDPEMFDKYQAWRRGTPEERRDMVLGFARDLGAQRRRQPPPVQKRTAAEELAALPARRDPESEAVTLAKSPSLPLPRIEGWRWDKDAFGRDMIVGRVYGKPGVPDGEHIETYPKTIRDGVAYTQGGSQYRLVLA